MVTRFKLIAAALGLVVAAGTIGDASAAIVHRTVVKKVVTTRVVAPHRHRVVVLPSHRVTRGPVVVRPHLAFHRTLVRKTIIR